jgi:hypothetical protein
MAVVTWNTTTINGKLYYVIESSLLHVPVEWVPGSQVFFAVAAPGASANFPATIKGDSGQPANLDTVVNLTALEPGDPTADSASMTPIIPPSVNTPGKWRLNLALHKGQNGADGDTIIDPADYGTPIHKKMLIVDPTLAGFQYQTQKVGDRWPVASINSTPTGFPSYTLAVCGIGPQDFDWRPTVSGSTIIHGNGPDLRVDLVARLNGETSGNDVGYCSGIAGQTDRLTLVPGPPPGKPDTWDRVPAGVAATVHLRTEWQQGTASYTTSSTETRFNVRVEPIL